MLKCLNCKDVIKSKHRHDFVTCSCGKVSVDGGNEYLRIIGDQKNYEIISESKGRRS